MQTPSLTARELQLCNSSISAVIFIVCIALIELAKCLERFPEGRGEKCRVQTYINSVVSLYPHTFDRIDIFFNGKKE